MRDKPIAALKDDHGRLIDEGRKPEMLQGSHTLLVPLDVRVEHHCPRWPPTPRSSTVPCLIYPVPEAWRDQAKSGKPFERRVSLLDLSASDLWGRKRGEKVSAEGWFARWYGGGP